MAPLPHPRRRDLLLVLLLALGVRLGFVPDWGILAGKRGLLRVFDGHERLYLAAFQGGPLADPAPSFHPGLGLLYQGLGALSGDPRLLIVLSAVLGALAAVGVAAWTGRRFGRRAGSWAGILVALLGEHAAWSTSAYPVILPHALLVGAFVARGWGAGLLCFLAAGLRPELALLALLRGGPGLFALPAALGWLLLLGVPPVEDSLQQPLLVLRANLPMLRFLGPPVLLLGLLGLRVPGAWVLLLAAIWTHLCGSLFADYGARHALFGGVALCALLGVAAARWGPVLGIVGLVGLGLDSAGLARIWHQRPDLSAEAAGLGPPPEGCIELSEEPPIPGQPLPSHLRYLSGEIDGDCFLWGEEAQHRAWSSRGLRDRALRMRRLYELRPVGAMEGPGGPRLYHRLDRERG